MQNGIIGGMRCRMNMTRDQYKDHYMKKLEEGEHFQEYVKTILEDTLNIQLSYYESKEDQLIGENEQGFEVKYDIKSKNSPNIYIEYQEKANIKNNHYVDSGIMRKDNTWIYCIGNEVELFLFSKKRLQELRDSKKYTFKHVQTETSKGFLIPKTVARKEADKYIKVDITDHGRFSRKKPLKKITRKSKRNGEDKLLSNVKLFHDTHSSYEEYLKSDYKKWLDSIPF
jgi:hypothetical protein